MERRHNFLKFITNYFVSAFFFITLLLLLTPLFKLNHIHCTANLNTNLPEIENEKRRNHLSQIQQQTDTVKLHAISTIFMNMEHKFITKKKWHQIWRWETSLSLHIIQTHCSRIVNSKCYYINFATKKLPLCHTTSFLILSAVNNTWRRPWSVQRVSQKLRSLLQDLIPELILSQKRHIHMGPIHNSSGVMSF